ncbi:MAG TPA: citryl-CoA lyase [Steroidobacteraceae bacterium]|jgi:citrate synthase|nr:citryl-CoA lyase [Steroidobacteraceae bacterium]
MAKTSIAGYDAEHVTIRGKDLVADLMGKVGFTELILLQLTGKTPTPSQVSILDAVLVTIMEHGLVPSAIVTRLTHYGAPESVQGAIVAGLLGVGDRFAGTASECSQVLEKIVQVAAGDRVTVANEVVKDYRARKRPIPGFGHPVHRDVDPRSQRLIDIVKVAHAAGGGKGSNAAAGDYIAALETLEQAVATVIGKRIVTNVSAAIAAALCEAGVPSKAARGIVLTARCAGLAGHLFEESEAPTGDAMWSAVTDAVRYEP